MLSVKENRRKSELEDGYLFVDDFFHFLEERRRKQWVSDDLSDKCLSCEKQFNLIRRRHHCRSCGGIFCYECSAYSIQIPTFLEGTPRPEYNPLDLKRYIPKSIRDMTLETLGYNKDETRVCYLCYRKIESIMGLTDIITIFSNVPLDIPNIKKLALVSKAHNKVARICLNNIRQLQFMFPDQTITKKDKEILWINRRYFAGHSKWLIPLIKSINWKSISIYDKKELIDLLYKPKKITCKSLGCAGQCNTQFTPEDAIICLYPYIEEKEVRNYIFQCLIKAPIEEILSYLPYLVYTCRYYYNKVKNKCQISDFLIHIAINNYIFLNYLYWELNLQMSDREHKTMYHNIKLKLLDKLDAVQNEIENREILLNSEGFVRNMALILQKQTTYNVMKEVIKDHLLYKNYFQNYPVSLPLQPSNLCIGVNINGMAIKDSATKPIYIPFNCISSNNSIEGNYVFGALYKTEDIRKDYIITKIILLMDLIIYRELGIEMNLINYAILPIDHKSGYVEIVQDSETIYNIHEKLKFTIQNFIIENNGSTPIDVLRERFVKSCAGYCVISYLLGIGDRHLDNIMITKDGFLFHIDYSFILGYDPKVITKNAFGGSEIRLTTDMIDMMGGIESRHYKKFKELCNTCYNCLRQHSNLFYILLSMLYLYKPAIDGEGSFTKDMIERHIIEKFIPHESNYEAKIHINTKLSNTTHQTIGTAISDFFHYYKKESWLGKTFRTN